MYYYQLHINHDTEWGLDKAIKTSEILDSWFYGVQRKDVDFAVRHETGEVFNAVQT